MCCCVIYQLWAQKKAQSDMVRCQVVDHWTDADFSTELAKPHPEVRVEPAPEPSKAPCCGACAVAPVMMVRGILRGSRRLPAAEYAALLGQLQGTWAISAFTTAEVQYTHAIVQGGEYIQKGGQHNHSQRVHGETHDSTITTAVVNTIQKNPFRLRRSADGTRLYCDNYGSIIESITADVIILQSPLQGTGNVTWTRDGATPALNMAMLMTAAATPWVGSESSDAEIGGARAIAAAVGAVGAAGGAGAPQPQAMQGLEKGVGGEESEATPLVTKPAATATATATATGGAVGAAGGGDGGEAPPPAYAPLP
jgi:hypothetical protein